MKRRLFFGLAAMSVVPALLLTDESSRLEKTIIDAGLGVKLVFLPDLHIHHEEKRLAEVLEAVLDEQPDVVVLGGDLVDEYTRDTRYVERFVSEIPGRERYFVMGNHEYWSGRDSWVRKMLHERNFREIRGLAESSRLGKIYGFDWSENRVYPRVSAEGLVFAHDPNAFDFVDGRCLMLAGHTHGGLVLGNLTLLSNSRYARGYYTAGQKSLYVSKGLGQIFPIRPFSSRELVVVV
ncbi:MAG: metallophosphoesterase [Candidatus Caldarchaeum sp.]|nr:metallophosphoesterase [Candidatus Caldarchaeum sp.]MDW8063711.1 metallophosphoesterase [Candidatus Caldarchaeum sp.]